MGDDVWLLADQDCLIALKPKLHATYTLKENGTLGPEAADDKVACSLNKKVRYRGHGEVEMEADSRNAKLIIAELGFQLANRVSTPGVKEPENAPEATNLLDAGEAIAYGGICARCLYLSLDRPDLRFAVKELARRMSAPTQKDLRALKRLGGYHQGSPRLVAACLLQDEAAGERNFL